MKKLKVTEVSRIKKAKQTLIIKINKKDLYKRSKAWVGSSSSSMKTSQKSNKTWQKRRRSPGNNSKIIYVLSKVVFPFSKRNR